MSVYECLYICGCGCLCVRVWVCVYGERATVMCGGVYCKTRFCPRLRKLNIS